MNWEAALDFALGRFRTMPSFANQGYQPSQYTDSFELSAQDLGKLVCCNKSSTITVTIPADNDLESKEGIEFHIFNHDANGDLALLAAEGVTIINPYSVASPHFIRLKKRGANTWHVIQIQ